MHNFHAGSFSEEMIDEQEVECPLFFGAPGLSLGCPSLALEHATLGGDPAESGISPHPSVGADHAMAGNRGREGVFCESLPDRSGRAGMADPLGQPAVGARLSFGDFRAFQPNFLIKRGIFGKFI